MPGFPFYSPRRKAKTKHIPKGMLKLLSRAKA